MGVVLLLKTLVDAAGVWLLADVWGLGMATMEKNGTGWLDGAWVVQYWYGVQGWVFVVCRGRH